MGKVRYTVDMSEKLYSIFESRASKEGVTKAEIFRRALCIYDSIREELENGKKLGILEKNKVIKEIVLFK